MHGIAQNDNDHDDCKARHGTNLVQQHQVVGAIVWLHAALNQRGGVGAGYLRHHQQLIKTVTAPLRHCHLQDIVA